MTRKFGAGREKTKGRKRSGTPEPNAQKRTSGLPTHKKSILGNQNPRMVIRVKDTDGVEFELDMYLEPFHDITKGIWAVIARLMELERQGMLERSIKKTPSIQEGVSQNKTAISLIRSWREEGDADEQHAVWQEVQKTLDEDTLSV